MLIVIVSRDNPIAPPVRERILAAARAIVPGARMARMAFSTLRQCAVELPASLEGQADTHDVKTRVLWAMDKEAG